MYRPIYDQNVLVQLDRSLLVFKQRIGVIARPALGHLGDSVTVKGAVTTFWISLGTCEQVHAWHKRASERRVEQRAKCASPCTEACTFFWTLNHIEPHEPHRIAKQCRFPKPFSKVLDPFHCCDRRFQRKPLNVRVQQPTRWPNSLINVWIEVRSNTIDIHVR